MKARLYAGTINHRRDQPGWRNVTLDLSNRGLWDPDLEMFVQPNFQADIADLSAFRPATFDEIVLHHVLEHLQPARAAVALEQLHRVLKPGGLLDIEVPDVGRVCKAFTDNEIDLDTLWQWLYGEQLPVHEVGDSHRSGWTEATLRAALEEAGFEVSEREKTGLALRFRAVKPG